MTKTTEELRAGCSELERIIDRRQAGRPVYDPAERDQVLNDHLRLAIGRAALAIADELAAVAEELSSVRSELACIAEGLPTAGRGM